MTQRVRVEGGTDRECDTVALLQSTVIPSLTRLLDCNTVLKYDEPETLKPFSLTADHLTGGTDWGK